MGGAQSRRHPGRKPRSYDAPRHYDQCNQPAHPARALAHNLGLAAQGFRLAQSKCLKARRQPDSRNEVPEGHALCPRLGRRRPRVTRVRLHIRPSDASAGESNRRLGVTKGQVPGVIGLALVDSADAPIAAMRELLEGSRDSPSHRDYDPERASAFAKELGLKSLPKSLSEEVAALLGDERDARQEATEILSTSDMDAHGVDLRKLLPYGFPSTVVATSLRVPREGRHTETCFVGTDDELVSTLCGSGVGCRAAGRRTRAPMRLSSRSTLLHDPACMRRQSDNSIPATWRRSMKPACSSRQAVQSIPTRPNIGQPHKRSMKSRFAWWGATTPRQRLTADLSRRGSG